MSAPDTFTEIHDAEYGTSMAQWKFARARYEFQVTRCDHDGETTMIVEFVDLDEEPCEGADAEGQETFGRPVHVHRFGGYEGDTSGMGVCPVAAARSFVRTMIDFRLNPMTLEERLAPFGPEWQAEQMEERGRFA